MHYECMRYVCKLANYKTTNGGTKRALRVLRMIPFFLLGPNYDASTVQRTIRAKTRVTFAEPEPKEDRHERTG